MTTDVMVVLAAIAAIGCGVLLGPMLLTVRVVMRPLMGRDAMQRWQIPVALGLGFGLVGATAVCGVLFGGRAAVFAATLGLLGLLALLDVAWRWLPFAWTLPVLGLGCVAAWAMGTFVHGLWGLLTGAGVLLTLQVGFQIMRGVTALGTGDIWLAAGLGMLTGPLEIVWVLGLAAATGLLVAGIQRAASGAVVAQRMGVAYGTHLCVAYTMVLLF